MARVRSLFEIALPLIASLLLLATVASVWGGRLTYPFDLEWMEGGMLAHAWRLQRGLPVYVPPNPDFVPYVYPPLYSAVVAALGFVFGLSMTLGRVVSVASALATSAAIGFAARRAGGSWTLALGAGAMFLGTYPQAGAFYDLVRPDSLALAFTAWSIAIALEDHPRAPVVSGLLLVGAFLTKQNLAGFGAPLLVGLTLRDWRAGLRFALASVVPALLAVGALQLWTGGQYLVWMLDVPASHPMAWARARYDVPREWGTALPVAFAVLSVGFVVDAVRRQRSLPPWLVAAAPVWLGMAAAWRGTYEPPPPGLYPFGYGTAYFALVAAPLALAGLGVGWVADRVRFGAAERPDWRWVTLTGLVLTAAAMALVMRVHESGYVNVHAPLFVVLALALGVNLAQWQLRWPPSAAWGGVAVAAQLVWSAGQFDRARMVPDAADEAVGWAFVEEIRRVDGEVFSPFAAWLPVYAGKPPSLHAMGLWDCNMRDGPYFAELDSVVEAMGEHKWALALGGHERVLRDVADFYEPVKVVVPLEDPRFRPVTGYLARPWRVMAPRARNRDDRRKR
ncbi:MAG: hypothetical protein ABMA64_31585 [Myxococcota bacterium]